MLTSDFADRILKVEESPTFALEKKADELDIKLKQEGKSIIRFGIGQPDFNTPANIKDAGKKAIDENKTKYTASTGIKELKNAIVNKFKRDNKIDYEVENILVGNGAKHVLDDIMRIFVNPDDIVIIPRPFWVSYNQQVILSGGFPEFVDFKEDLKIDIEHFKHIVTGSGKTKESGRVKLFILNSPNNPTGEVYTKEELEEIGGICLEHDIYIIADEVYEKFLYGSAEHHSIASFSNELKSRTLTVNAVSKTYAMTGWRIGYCAAKREIIKQMAKVQDQSTSNPCTISQWAALEALNGNQNSVEVMRKEYEKRKDYIYSRISSIDGMDCALPEGAFYIFPRVSNFFNSKIKNSFDFADLLLEKANVAVVPGGAFGADEYIRISYATSMDNIEEGLNRIEEFCSRI
ncbi:MAG: pyridoxal phosphate-dependent aminotransferase [Actinobacteria bacterium]|nr:pyridoxal phosphate-dependent aminotransferase [Actinomycetota bacterium]MBL7123920.1 pyridoxal phosphate-dependent aminotransferase [Actinomycetota bacterium]